MKFSSVFVPTALVLSSFVASAPTGTNSSPIPRLRRAKAADVMTSSASNCAKRCFKSKDSGKMVCSERCGIAQREIIDADRESIFGRDDVFNLESRSGNVNSRAADAMNSMGAVCSKKCDAHADPAEKLKCLESCGVVPTTSQRSGSHKSKSK